MACCSSKEDEVKTRSSLSNVFKEGDNNSCSALFAAIKSKDSNLVKTFLSEGVNINEKDAYEGITAVHLAAKLNCENLVKILINNGANVNIPDKNGVTPLHCAIRQKRIGIVKLLLDGGADPLEPDELGETALHNAARYSFELVELVLEKVVNVDIKTYHGMYTGERRTPLMVAADAGNMSSLLLLLNKGANVCRKSSDMKTALHFADSGCMVEILWAYGADINARDGQSNTPLHFATLRNKCDVIEALLTLGARVDIINVYTYSYNDSSPHDDLCKTRFKTTQFSFTDMYKDSMPDQLAKRVTELMIKFKQAGHNKNITDIITVRSCDVSESFSSECLLEVERMREVKFGKISLYDILITGLIKCSYAANVEICETIVNDRLEQDFPLYHSILRRNLRIAKRRSALLYEAAKEFEKSVERRQNVKLPEEICHAILSELSTAELIHFNRALNYAFVFFEAEDLPILKQ